MADGKVLLSLIKMKALLEKWGFRHDDWILTGQYAYGLFGYEVPVRKGHHNILVDKAKIPWDFPKDALEVHPPVGSAKARQFREFMKQTGFEFDFIPLNQRDFDMVKKISISYSLPNLKTIFIQDEVGQLMILENILKHSNEAGWGEDKGRRIFKFVEALRDAFERSDKSDLAKAHDQVLKKYPHFKSEENKIGADHQLAELLKTQKSLTEWLKDIKHQDTELIRREDNEKRERLKVLNKVIGLPFDEPTQFEAVDLRNKSAEFKIYLKEHGQELCALRLIPKKDGLAKLRMRGKTIKDAYKWFLDQKINAADYRADFIPHPPDYAWATIFVVNKHGLQGEIIWGGHHQLTQGFHTKNRPHIFRYDFKKWMISPHDEEALEHLNKLAGLLHVPAANKKKLLKKQLGSTFAHDYLEGYFESADSSLGTWFMDYSPALGKIYEDMIVKEPVENKGLVNGLSGSLGQASGPVKIVKADNVNVDFKKGSVLVCEVTTPNYVPLMQKAAAIVTDQGGILSHAAIVARELKVPCIVGTGNATKVLKNGQVIRVNADLGTVT